MYQRFKVKVLLIIIFLTLFDGLSNAEPFSLSIEDLANLFSTYFPKVEGTLSQVENDQGTVNLGEKNGLVKGLVLDIVRPGAPFFHPITHEEMGRFEEKIGLLEVESIEEGVSRGNLHYSGKKPQTGDIVRITAARIPVLITGEADKKNIVIIDEFSRLLVLTDRFLAPSISNLKTESHPSGDGREPVYEFKVQSLQDQRVKVELVNLPFQHRIDQLTTTTGGNLQ